MDLYNHANYKDVTEILSDALTAEPSINCCPDEIISRPMQYAIILDSYWKLGKFKVFHPLTFTFLIRLELGLKVLE